MCSDFDVKIKNANTKNQKKKKQTKIKQLFGKNQNKQLNLQQTFHNTTPDWLLEQQHAPTSRTPHTHTHTLLLSHTYLRSLWSSPLFTFFLSFALRVCRQSNKQNEKQKKKKTMSSIEGQSSSASSASCHRRRRWRRHLQEFGRDCNRRHHTHSIVGHQWHRGRRRAARRESYHSLATDQ